MNGAVNERGPAVVRLLISYYVKFGDGRRGPVSVSRSKPDLPRHSGSVPGEHSASR